MKGKRSTKNALISSILVFALCVSMLIGATFAWFTDTASTGVNKIQAGTLDVAVEYSIDGNEWKDIQGATSLFSNNLWEPGHTEYVYLRVKNAGNLALKYKVMVTPISENGGINVAGNNFKLSDYLVFGTTAPSTNAVNYADRTAARNAVGTTTGLNQAELTKEGTIAANGTDQYMALVVYMPETVGNEANAKPGTDAPSIDLGITVVATQKDAESDSYGSDYDAGVQYPITVPANIEVDDNNKVSNPVTVESAQKVADTTTPLAKVTVPSGASVIPDVTQLVLTIEETDTPTNFVAAVGTDNKTFEIDMKGLDKDNNTKLFKVEIYVGPNLASFKLYHNGVAMAKKNSLSDVQNDQDYYYDSVSGVVTFLTMTFSPFTYSCNKDSWTNHVAERYSTPVDTTKKVITINSAEELALFSKEVSSTTNYSNYTVNISSDINLGQYIWKPINGWGRMSGIVFNGNNHAISNMIVQGNYEGSTGGFGTGFIGNTNGAITINDITFIGADVSFSKSHSYNGNVGGIIMGYTYGTTEFKNVSVLDSSIYGYGKIGAFLGMGADPGVKVTFNNCVSKNNTIGAVYDMGGLAGLIQRRQGADNTTVQNCTVENINVKLSSAHSYENLDNVTATFKQNDKDGEEISKTLSGHFWIYSGYYWGGYADYYVSYGNSSFDAPITTEGYNMMIANSEYPVNK